MRGSGGSLLLLVVFAAPGVAHRSRQQQNGGLGAVCFALEPVMSRRRPVRNICVPNSGNCGGLVAPAERNQRANPTEKRALTEKRFRGRWWISRTATADATGTVELLEDPPLDTPAETNGANNLDSGVFTSIRGGSRKKETPRGPISSLKLPMFDELDRRIWSLAIPCIANFAIGPLIGAVDLFWVNRMRNPLAVAGQAAANQVFFTANLFLYFLPSVTTTLVSKHNASQNKEELQDTICQSLAVGGVLALACVAFMWARTETVLSAILQRGAPAMEYAKPYLLIRSVAFLPATITMIGFSTFRGLLDTRTPLIISLVANLFNAVVDPILIFGYGMGVSGAALASVVAEIVSAVTFLSLLFRRELVSFSKLFRWPQWSRFKPLLKGGSALQVRNLSLNLTFLAVSRATQAIDQTGVAASGHALAYQVFQVGGVVLLAMSTVAQIMIPSELVEKVGKTATTGGPRAAKQVANRLMTWGFFLGCILGCKQMALLPLLQRGTPLLEVRRAARVPSYIASGLQVINGLVFIGEGIMVGCSNFLQVSISTLVATLATLQALRIFPAKFGLTGVWMGYIVFNFTRLTGVAIHQLRTGRIATRQIQKQEASRE